MSATPLSHGRRPESSYHVAGDRKFMTPSPPAQRDDSYDEHTPSRQSVQSITEYTTPSRRTNTPSISQEVRDELQVLYEKIYGPGLPRCVLTQGTLSVEVAHAVRRASKANELTLYEYCLGLDYGRFHVDSRYNIFHLKSDWHGEFDRNRWILLPSTTVLEEIHGFIQSVISARKETAAAIPAFPSHWRSESKKKYTFIPLPSITTDPVFVISSEAGQPVDWHGHRFPFHTVPEVECHIAPPFAAINGGAKCSAVNLNAIVSLYESSNLPPALEGRLDLLRQIWELIQNAKEEADSWRKNTTKGKRKREQDDEDVDRLSRSTRLTTRSQSRILHRRGDDVEHCRKRKAPPSSCGTTLTKRAVLRFSKRQKPSDFRTTVMRWAESIQG